MAAASSGKAPANRWRASQIVGGIIAAIVGIWILVEPTHAAGFLTIVVACYAIVGGVAYLIGAFGQGLGGGARFGHIALGVVFIVAGIIAVFSLQQATAFLFGLVSVLVGILWVFQGIVAFSALGDVDSKFWTVVFAIISLAAGIALLVSPLAGAGVLWLLLGISLVIVGITEAIRGIASKPML